MSLALLGWGGVGWGGMGMTVGDAVGAQYSFGISWHANFILSTRIPSHDGKPWYDLLLWTPCYHSKRGMCGKRGICL